jgi:hypothetical protein
MFPEIYMPDEDSPFYLEFNYTNWRLEDHHYVILFEKIEWTDKGMDRADAQATPLPRWVMHGRVLLRDGMEHLERYPPEGRRLVPCRRSFVMDGMRDVAVVKYDDDRVEDVHI